MLGNVGERLLHDAEHGELGVARKAHRRAAGLRGHLDAGALAEQRGMPAQRGHQAELVQRRGPQVGHHAADRVDGGFHQRSHGVQARAGDQVAARLQPLLERLQVDAERGQVLADEVVQLVGDAPPLGFLRLHQPVDQAAHVVGIAARLVLGLDARADVDGEAGQAVGARGIGERKLHRQPVAVLPSGCGIWRTVCTAPPPLRTSSSWLRK